MRQPPGSDGHDQHSEYWLTLLRDGAPEQKAEARLQLAADFEARGMPGQAVELLVANAQAGFRSPETFETLARLYRQLGNEYLAVSAAMEANRLREQGARSQPARFQPAAQTTPPRAAPPRTAGPPLTSDPPPPSYSDQSMDGRRWQPGYDASARARPRSQRGPASGSGGEQPMPARWQRPLRIVGWVAVVLIVAAALAVGGMQPLAGVAYAVAAGALALMLAGQTGLRRSLRVLHGPLGDGGLLFLAVLLFLTGGALLPRTTTTPPVVGPPQATPGSLYRGTPTPPPAVAGGLATPAAAPAAGAATSAGPPGSSPPPAAGDAATGDLTGQRFVVAGDPAGASLRVTPGSPRSSTFAGDGDVVVAVAADRTSGGRTWRQVTVPTGERGWIEIERLKPAPATLPTTFPWGLPPSGRSCVGPATIKGNINAAGELIYLRPTSEYYYRTFPEVCFRSEADAQAAGFQPSPR